MEKLARPFLLQKAAKIASACQDYVTGRVLDLGAGRCYISQELQRRLPISVVSADVANLNQTDLPFVIYDGINLPFPDKTFDTILLVYRDILIHISHDPPAKFLWRRPNIMPTTNLFPLGLHHPAAQLVIHGPKSPLPAAQLANLRCVLHQHADRALPIRCLDMFQ
jgi:hypothetical protein